VWTQGKCHGHDNGHDNYPSDGSTTGKHAPADVQASDDESSQMTISREWTKSILLDEGEDDFVK
jgi:hypothetical protein